MKLLSMVTCVGAVVASGLPTLADTSFSKGCLPMDGQFYGEDKVGFYCFNNNVPHHDYMYSIIDLGLCVGNNGGDLIRYENGEYFNTCRKCSLTSVRKGGIPTCYLECECSGMKHAVKKSKIDLNDVLENDNGRLVCFKHRGTSERLPPKCFHNEECSFKMST